MWVQFKLENYRALKDELPESDWLDVAETSLVDQQCYVVVALLGWNSSASHSYDVVVSTNGHAAILPFDARLFSIVDPRLSRFWQIHMDGPKELHERVELRLAFPEWDRSFLERVVDSHRAETDTFVRYFEQMKLEFAPPFVDSSATQLDLPWVMCPDCTEAWEVDPSLELAICPACDSWYVNPYTAEAI